MAAPTLAEWVDGSLEMGERHWTETRASPDLQPSRVNHFSEKPCTLHTAHCTLYTLEVHYESEQKKFTLEVHTEGAY